LDSVAEHERRARPEQYEKTMDKCIITS
jgi:hypothetical protein